MKNNIQRVKSVYEICLAVLTGIVGILFIVQTWSIFLSNASEPYTVSIIKEKFMQILVPVALWGIAVLLGGVLWYQYPDAEEKIKAYRDVRAMLTRLKGRVSKEGQELPEIRKESKFRTILAVVGIALCIFTSAVCLFFLLSEAYEPRFDSEFFTGHGAAADRLVAVFPWILAAFVAVVILAFLMENSRKREWECLKKVIAQETREGTSKSGKTNTLKDKIGRKFAFIHSKKFILGVRIGFAVLGVTLFIVGIANGGMVDVYEKAKNICTQCIGLG